MWGLLRCIHASCLINTVCPSLIEINNKNDIISEATEPVQSWHGDDEAEEVVDDGVQETVEQGSTRHVLDALETIVDVELRSHIDEAKCVDATDESVEYKSV